VARCMVGIFNDVFLWKSSIYYDNIVDYNNSNKWLIYDVSLWIDSSDDVVGVG